MLPPLDFCSAASLFHPVASKLLAPKPESSTLTSALNFYKVSEEDVMWVIICIAARFFLVNLATFLL